MSYFAVLSEQPDQIAIAHCHLNIWVLTGLFGRRVFYLDVGLGIKVSGSRPAKLSIALPGAVSDGDAEDLRQITLKNANLIFGEPAKVVDRRIEYGNDTLCVSGVRASRDTNCGGEDYCIWDIEPTDWSEDGETYVRVRFRLTSFARSWVPQRSGALLDLRLCDVREAVNSKGLESIDNRICSIEHLNVFAIIPASLKARAQSPAPRHVRLLEGEAWSDYLQRRTSRLSKRKLLVYHWRHKEEINRQNPFRAFLDLSEEHAVIRRRTLAFVALVAALTVVISRELFSSWATETVTLLRNQLTLVLSLVSLGAILKLFPQLATLPARVRQLRGTFRWFENRYYGN